MILIDKIADMLHCDRKKMNEVVSYLFFGVLTTIVNYVAYYVFTRPLGISVTWSTFWAWVLAVLFAFVTNKIWVFHSRSSGIAALARELAAFVAARVFSGALDVGMMWLFVEVCGLPDMWIKLAGNVVVTILNYIFSKLWIFKK
ncbi:MAG: GtrA family protein [Pyramidobacter sp.]|nr:GtrA family protein [Pyramidobacter sp.]